MQFETNVLCPHCNANRGRTWYPAKPGKDEGYYCHACKRFDSTNPKSQDTKRQFVHLTTEPRIKLPQDTTYFPDLMKSYLRHYHFSPELIKKSRAFWANDVEVYSWRKEDFFSSGPRVVFPHFKDKKLEFFEARSLNPKTKLKWVTGGSKKALYRSIERTDGPIVFVEDVVSCLRVSEVADAVALRGTSIHLDHMLYFEELGRPVIVWLDNDTAGRQGANQLSMILKTYQVEHSIMTTEHDPKCYKKKEIEEFINGVPDAG